MRQAGAKVTIVGYAQSNARVSTLMRNIEASPWLTKPELVEIKLVPMPGTRDQNQKINEFTLAFLIKRSTPRPLKRWPFPGSPVPPPRSPPPPRAGRRRPRKP